MIDIHCHILPGVDDGPADISLALDMARVAVSDGIKTIVATPHVGDGNLSPELIRSLTSEMNERLQDMDLQLAILPGADVNIIITPERYRDYTIATSPYVLIEFPHMHLPENAREIIFRLVSEGLRPIITHPERNGSVIRDPRLAEMFMESGGLVQITAGSLTGDFGPEVRACAAYLLKQGFVHFLATDAHSASWRPPILSDGVKAAQKIVGMQRANALVHDNPATVLAGGIIRA